MSDLRDRIAKTIYDTPSGWEAYPWDDLTDLAYSWDDLTDDARQVWREQADAVIAALGLKHYCRECGGWGPKDD